jgi:hypothetical protein
MGDVLLRNALFNKNVLWRQNLNMRALILLLAFVSLFSASFDVGKWDTAFAADQCLGVDPQASAPFAAAVLNDGCHVRMSPTGYPLPDSRCTPGAVNPTVTVSVLVDSHFRTKCVRDGATTPAPRPQWRSWPAISRS